MGRQRKNRHTSAPPPVKSSRLLVYMNPGDVGLFRFLLEAHENLAYFTVLERKTALLKLIYSPQAEETVRRALAETARYVPLRVEPWPLP